MTDEAPPAGTASQPRKILVVDDNVEVAEMLRAILDLAGYTATVATHPVQALELAARLEPAVVILDIDLPVMNGYELVHRLRSLPALAGSLFIAMTGYGQAHDPSQSRDSGFQHHLVKPVDVDHLLKIVAEPI